MKPRALCIKHCVNAIYSPRSGQLPRGSRFACWRNNATNWLRDTSRAPKLCQVRAGHLAVDDLDVACTTLLDQTRQCHLRCVAFEAEHRLAEEDLAELDAVQAARQPLFAVSFDGVAEPELVQLFVGIDHLGVQPGVGPGAARRGAAADGRAEGMVDPGRKRPIAQCLAASCASSETPRETAPCADPATTKVWAAAPSTRETRRVRRLRAAAPDSSRRPRRAVPEAHAAPDPAAETNSDPPARPARPVCSELQLLIRRAVVGHMAH